MPIMSKQSFKAKIHHASFSEKNKKIHNFLKNNFVAVVASVDFNDNPDASPIYYAIDNRFNITFATKSGTKKFENFKHNDNVALVVFDAPRQATATIKGKISLIKSPAETQKIFLNALSASLKSTGGSLPPLSKIASGSCVAYKITPTQIVLAVYGSSDSKTNNRIFEVIDF